MKKLTWSRGDLILLEHCPACRHRIDYEPKYIRNDDEGIMPDTWSIYNCPSCKSFFVNPRPSKNSLAGLYQDYLTHKPTQTETVFTSESLFWKLVRGYLTKSLDLNFDKHSLNIGYTLFSLLPPLRYKLDRFGRNLTKKNFSKKGKLLDLGCGAGEFLNIAQQMGFDSYGCDFDPIIIEQCKHKSLKVRLGGLESYHNDETFDVITMNQVIEHVIDPQQTIKDCFKKLNYDGCLWIGTPNPQASGAQVFGKNWVGLHPPYHLCIPSQSELLRWLNEAGFQNIKILNRGPHAKFNWVESLKLMQDFKDNQRSFLHGLTWNLIIDCMNCITPKYGEETVIIGYKKTPTP